MCVSFKKRAGFRGATPHTALPLAAWRVEVQPWDCSPVQTLYQSLSPPQASVSTTAQVAQRRPFHPTPASERAERQWLRDSDSRGAG